jgi:hypothetical protein
MRGAEAAGLEDRHSRRQLARAIPCQALSRPGPFPARLLTLRPRCPGACQDRAAVLPLQAASRTCCERQSKVNSRKQSSITSLSSIHTLLGWGGGWGVAKGKKCTCTCECVSLQNRPYLQGQQPQRLHGAVI